MKNNEWKVGVFSAVAIVLLYLGFNFLKGVDFLERKKKYYALYENINQLAISNPVLVNGYAVGRVNRIKILQKKNNQVLVEMEIDSDIVLTDATKAILNSELFGGKSVLLKIGHSGVKLKAGDTLKSEVAKGMFDVLSETATPVATDFQTTLRKFNATIDDLNKYFSSLDIILKKLQSTPDLLNATLVNTNKRMDELSASLKQDADKTAVLIDGMKPIVANFKTISDSLKQLQLNRTLLTMNRTIASLNESMAKLKNRNNTMGRLFTEDSLYVNVNKLMVNLNKLSYHLNTNPKHFLAPLGKRKKKIDQDLKSQEEEKKKLIAK